MYWQTERLRGGGALAVGSTYRLDLPEFGFLGSLMLWITGDEVSGVYDNGGAWRMVDHITQVELVANGSTVIKNLTGQLAQALAFYDQGIVARDRIRNYASNTQMCSIVLNLGRYLHDPDYGLDLGKYDNVELRVTTDATASEYASGLSINVDAIFQRPTGTARSLGFMRSEVWRQYTTVQDAWEYLEIPSEHLIRRILIQATPAYDATTKGADTKFDNVIYEIQHRLKTGELQVFDGLTSTLVRENAYDYGYLPLVAMHPYVNADKAVRTGVGDPDAHVFTVGTYSGAVETTIVTLTSGQTVDTLAFENAQAGGPLEGLVLGAGYHNTVVLRHDYNRDPITWLDPATYRTVLLNLHTRNSSSADNGTARILLDRLVRY